MKRSALLLSVGAIVMLLASGAMAKQPKVDVCHVPPDNPANAHTINISPNAVPDHLAHGDSLGECECQVDEDCFVDDDNLCTRDTCLAGSCLVGAKICFPGEECNPDTGECEGAIPGFEACECECDNDTSASVGCTDCTTWTPEACEANCAAIPDTGCVVTVNQCVPDDFCADLIPQ